MSEYYIENDGKTVSVDVQTWAREFDRANRQVARDTISGSEISTVFLGIDHSYGVPPLLYETLVFGGSLDQEMKRYTTREEAVAGHAEMVERVRANQCE